MGSIPIWASMPQFQRIGEHYDKQSRQQNRNSQTYYHDDSFPDHSLLSSPAQAAQLLTITMLILGEDEDR